MAPRSTRARGVSDFIRVHAEPEEGEGDLQDAYQTQASLLPVEGRQADLVEKVRADAPGAGGEDEQGGEEGAETAEHEEAFGPGADALGEDQGDVLDDLHALGHHVHSFEDRGAQQVVGAGDDQGDEGAYERIGNEYPHPAPVARLPFRGVFLRAYEIRVSLLPDPVGVHEQLHGCCSDRAHDGEGHKSAFRGHGEAETGQQIRAAEGIGRALQDEYRADDDEAEAGHQKGDHLFQGRHRARGRAGRT